MGDEELYVSVTGSSYRLEAREASMSFSESSDWVKPSSHASRTEVRREGSEGVLSRVNMPRRPIECPHTILKLSRTPELGDSYRISGH
jgi:hypothetical protein